MLPIDQIISQISSPTFIDKQQHQHQQQQQQQQTVIQSQKTPSEQAPLPASNTSESTEVSRRSSTSTQNTDTLTPTNAGDLDIHESSMGAGSKVDCQERESTPTNESQLKQEDAAAQMNETPVSSGTENILRRQMII